MADSTAPLLLAGGMTMLSDYLQHKGVEYRVALATGLACGAFALLERANHELAVGAAWLALVASLITPRANGTQAPMQTFLREWQAGATPTPQTR